MPLRGEPASRIVPNPPVVRKPARWPILVGCGFFLCGGAGLLFALEEGRAQLERSFSELLHVPVTIERLTVSPAGLVVHHAKFPRHLVVERLQIQGSLLSRSVQSVDVTGINLSLAGLPLTAQGHVFLQKVPEGPSRCAGFLTAEHPLFKARASLSGNARTPILEGWVETVPGMKRNFLCQLEVNSESLTLTRMEIQGGPTLNGLVQFPPGGSIKLDLWVRFNEQIPREIVAAWDPTLSQLHFDVDLFGDEAHASGQIQASPPYPLDATLDLKGLQLADLVQWVHSGRGIPPSVSGQIRGRVVVQGPLRRLVSRGELVSRDGTFGRQNFSLATLRFSGVGPLLQIENSHVTKETGVLLLEGTVDLRRLGHPDFMKGIRWSSLEKTMNIGDWQMGLLSPGRSPSSSGLKMHHQTSSDRVKVGLAYEVDDQTQPNPVSKEGVEVEYPLSAGQRVNVRLEKDEEVLAVEHHEKF